MKGSPSANVIVLLICDAEENALKNVVCFVKKGMDKFTYTKTHSQDKEVVDKRSKIKTTRCGRIVRPLDQLSLWSRAIFFL